MREDFLVYLKLELNSSPKTINAYGKDTRYFLTYLDEQGIDSVKHINTKLLQQYIQYLVIKKSYKARSQARTIASLRAFCEFLIIEKIIQFNPARDLEIPKLPKSLPAFLTKEEVESMIAVADDGSPEGKRDAAIICYLFYTASRLEELIGAKLSDISSDFGSVLIHGKGSKESLIPIHPVLKGTLLEYIQYYRKETDSPFLFPGIRGSRQAPATIRRMVGKIANKAGIEKTVSPHTLRHSMATCLAQTEGVEIIDIQQFLRHSKLSSTQIYLHTDVSRLRAAVETLPVI